MTIANIKNKITARLNNGNNPVAKERELWEIILNEAVKLFEVKDILVNTELYPTYLVDNFDNTGLGKNDMLGFAICNGNNGTYPMDGRVTVSYGEGYATIGAIGGSKNAVVVEHTHSIRSSAGSGGFVGPQRTNGTETTSVTASTGESGVNKNMQPYIVVLKIQRIN
jgi:hypothetical protein